MKIGHFMFFQLFAAIISLGAINGLAETRMIDPSNYIWFSKPAGKWDGALPVGNGRLGAISQ